MNNNPISPQVLLNRVESLLTEMVQKKEIHNIDVKKYYIVDSKLRLADKDCDVAINDVFSRLIGSIQNRSMMPNVIKYWDYKDDVFDKVLKHHEPTAVLKAYHTAEELYKAILENWKDKKPLEKELKGLWKQWCEGVLSAAKFLAQFKNTCELRQAFDCIYNNRWTRPALPALLAMEISGIQFTLACDFLKECGYDYPKPDVHVTDVFEHIIGTRDTYSVFKAVIQYAAELQMSAYQLDKMIWLVCSGNFYLDKNKTGDRIKITDKKDELIKTLKNINHYE